MHTDDTDRTEAGRKCRSPSTSSGQALHFAAEAATPVGMTRSKATAGHADTTKSLKVKHGKQVLRNEREQAAASPVK